MLFGLYRKSTQIKRTADNTDKEAKELTIWWQQQVPFDHLDLSYMISEMQETFGELELPYSDEEVDEMLKISNFDFDQYASERPQDDSNPDVRTLALIMVKDKYDFIVAALDAVIAQEELQPNDRPRALELIVADYTSGK